MRLLSGALSCWLCLTLCGPALASPDVTPKPAAKVTGASKPMVAAGIAAPGDYAGFIIGAQRQAGLIDLLKKNDTVYFDLKSDQLDKPFLIEPSLAAGVGTGAFAGRMYDAFVVKFERRANRIFWVEPNSDFSAAKAGSQALQTSIGESTIAVSPILAQDAAQERIIFAPSVFETDFEGIGAELGRRSARPVAPIPGLIVFGPQVAFGLDASRTYVEKTKALPANDELSVVLGFTGPPDTIVTVPDSRGFELKMHYSIVELPPSGGYVPRLADERVGYQIVTHVRLGDDAARSPLVRYINRWDLRKGPIVFYLSNSIPPAYRASVRSALLVWNNAFARIGMNKVVEVRDQPNDPAWDPDDARYSVVRWITSYSPDFAGYAGVAVNPYTGEILRAGIVLDGEDIRTVAQSYRDFGVSTQALTDPSCAGRECAYVAEYADQAAFARTALLARGTGLDEAKFSRDWMRSVVLHESGHIFGLRHNFEASTLYTPAQLHSKSFTASHGISASVMDYSPINIGESARAQGEYFQEMLGPYDYWAIKYGYMRTGAKRPADEVPALRAVARESTLPGHAYGSDEDAYGPGWVDPRISAFDLSSDPLEFEEEQLRLSDRVLSKLDRTFPRNDASYYQERLSFATVMRNYVRAALLAVRYIGGSYTSRTRSGQPGGAAPFRPIPRATAHRAFALLAEHVFSSRAFHFPPGLVSHLGADTYYDISRPGTRPDFPLTLFVGLVQDTILGKLFDPPGLARINDFETQAAPRTDPLRLEDVFEWSRTAIWDDVSAKTRRILPLHRELQRHFTDLMVAYAEVPTGLLANAGAPRESQALALYELRQIDAQIDRALRVPGKDVATRAHLEEERARIGRALHASNIQAP